MSKLVTALYETRSQAEAATSRLLAEGFSRDDICLLMSDETRGREFVLEEHTKAPEGATTGAATGGALGGIAAGLVGVGVLAVPGLNLLAAGPIVAALAGVGAGGALGGLIGALVGAGLREHEAKLAAEKLAERGHILVGVYAHDDRRQLAREIMETSGAQEVAG